MLYQKTIGYLLLTIGIFTLVLSTLNLYQVYSGKETPPQIIQQSALKLDLASLINSSNQNLNQNSPNPNPVEILSEETISTSINLFIYFVAMSFIAGTGFRLATLGVQIIRPINIHTSVLG